MANSYESYINRAIDGAQHVPTEFLHPGAAVLAAAATIGVGVLAKHYHDTTDARGAYDARGNGAQIQKSLIGHAAKNNKYHFSPTKKMVLGMGLLAVQALGQPGYEASFDDSSSEAVIVADASNSTIYTHDLTDTKNSRYEASVAAIGQATFPGSLGLIEFASGAPKVVTKPVKNWDTLVPAMKKPEVNPNGGALVPALEQAVGLLKVDPKTKKRSGTIIVVSDGSVNENSAELRAEATKLKQAGVNAQVVVVGSNAGEYIVPQTTTKTKSPASTDALSALDGKLKRATSQAELTSALKTEIATAGIGHEHRPWPIPGTIGVMVLGLAGVQFVNRNMKKKS